VPISLPGSPLNWPIVTDRMDVTNDPTSVTTTWTTLADSAGHSLVKAFSSHSGRTHELGRTDTGTATVEVENSDGRFDPTNTASPLNSAGKSLLPMRRYNRQATWNGVTYDIWTGNVERYPQSWAESGNLGSVAMTCVDALAPLSQITLKGPVQAELLLQAPTAYYPLRDEAGSTSAASIAATPQPLARILHGKATGGISEFGSVAGSGNLSGDTGTGLTLTPTLNTLGVNLAGNYLRTADASGGPMLALGGFSVSGWFNGLDTATNFDSQLFLQSSAASVQQAQIYLNPITGGYSPIFQLGDGTTNIIVSGTTLISDGLWHHIGCTLAADNKTAKLYVDGVLQATTVGALALVWKPGVSQIWGGLLTPAYSYGSSFLHGTLAHLAIFKGTVLTGAQMLTQFTSGANFVGDTSGVRAARYLNYANWPTAARALDAGNSTIGGGTVTGESVSQALLDLTEWEAGCLYVAPDGKLTFKARSARFNASSVATFGDGAGELPYLGDILFDFDTDEIYNDIQMTRTGGISVEIQDTTSQGHYYPRSLPQTVGLNTDAETTDRANFRLGYYKDPHLRLARLTIEPSSNPALWPTALGRVIGERVTVKRRPLGGAPVISADFFIEAIDHNVIPGSWKTTYLLSPAGSQISDFWRIEDPVYGYIEGSGGHVSYPVAY
jgi:hypothetical protein